jgi:anti-sigma factor RsiW
MTGSEEQANFERDHQWAREHLSEYVDDELSPPSIERLGRHLDNCNTCRQILESLRRTVGALGKLSAPAAELKATEIALLVEGRLDEDR